MHWNNGTFHEDLDVKGSITITDYKHNAISGEIEETTFGDTRIDTNINGKNINIENTDNENDIIINSHNYLNIETRSGITINNDNIYKKDVVYGTSLPSTGVEGQVFFKLIY